ncbi:MAG: ABC transporter permease [Acidobacteria bacterium]|nr:ABC transporter permease [Acidobacteriota bacterium]
MMLAIFILGAFLLLGTNLNRALAHWERQIQFHVFLSDAVTPEQTDNLLGLLRSDPSVASARLIDKAEARKRFDDDYADYADISQNMEINPFPASIQVALASGADESRFRQLQDKLKKQAGVEEIHYDFELFKRLHFFSEFIQWTAYLLCGIVVFASIFTISNVLKLTFFSRRDEVDIMKLVGASRAYIRGPFMVEGMLQGLFGAGMGLVLLFLALFTLQNYLNWDTNSLLGQFDLVFLNPGTIWILLGGGCLVGLFGAAISLNQFLHEHISYQ